jgi:hypothetical protein
MSVLEFEVYYEHQPTLSNPFPLENEDVERKLRLLRTDLELVLPNSRVSYTLEDYANRRIRIRIETETPEEEVVSEVKRALSLAKLLGKQLGSGVAS